jgi:hypothetical protein
MARSTAVANRRIPHPLQTLRFITGLTREACASIADLSTSAVQNIELGKSPLYLENAELLEAYTNCHALHLLDQIAKWRNGELKQRADLFTLKGEPFTEETFAAYQAEPLPAEDRERAIEDIRTRVDLLLGALAGRPHAFRAAYRRMVQFTLQELERTGLTQTDLLARGQQQARVETRQTTVGKLAKDQEIGGHGAFKKEIAPHYPPETPVMMSIETFPSWPRADSNRDFWLLSDPNLRTGTATLKRMNFPDGKQHTIRHDVILGQDISFTSFAGAFWAASREQAKMDRKDFELWQNHRRSLSRQKAAGVRTKDRKRPE